MTRLRVIRPARCPVLAQIRAALPPLLRELDSVEELEESVGTVAATVEPLQGVTRGVGRMSERLSRR